MADPVTDPTANEAEVKTKFKTWVNEVFDEREAKAKTDADVKAQADKDAAEKAAKSGPGYYLRQFLGI